MDRFLLEGKSIKYNKIGIYKILKGKNIKIQVISYPKINDNQLSQKQI